MERCKICGEEFKILTLSHLKFKHDGMTPEEYDKIEEPISEEEKQRASIVDALNRQSQG
jgi:hypothetical protein